MRRFIFTCLASMVMACNIGAASSVPSMPEIDVLQPRIDLVYEDYTDSVPKRLLNSAGRVFNRARGVAGSATCIGRVEAGLVWLTNEHVAGKTGNSVTITPYTDGYKRKSLSGKVIWYMHSGSRDAALVLTGDDETVTTMPLGIGYVPVMDGAIACYGCSSGRPPRFRLGRITSIGESTIKYAGGAIPYPGDSGSGVFNAQFSELVALVTWNSGGSSPTWGKAQLINGVWEDIRKSLKSDDEEILELFDLDPFSKKVFPPKEEEESKYLGLFERLFQRLSLSNDASEKRHQTLLEKVSNMEIGILDRIRRNRLLYEQEMLKLERQRHEMLLEFNKLEKEREKERKGLNDHIDDLKRKYFSILGFLELIFWIIVIACIIWVGTALFGAGWILKATTFVRNAIVTVASEVWGAVVIAVTPGKTLKDRKKKKEE